ATGAAAAAAGTAFAQGGAPGQGGGQPDVAAPAVATGAVAGLTFKALVRWGPGTQIVDVRLRELQPTQVLVRTKATCGCYTIAQTVLGTNNVMNPQVPNHSTM